MPGSQTSRKMASKVRFRSSSRHASPLSASATLYPSSSSTPFRDWRTPDSSSTIRTLCMLRGSQQGSGLGCDRQFYDELSSHGLVLFYSDRAAMILNYSAYNC